MTYGLFFWVSSGCFNLCHQVACFTGYKVGYHLFASFIFLLVFSEYPTLYPLADNKMSLTALEIKNISCPPDKKQIKKSDGNGLYLLVTSSNSKLWRFRYKYTDKHQEMALGKYPTVSLHQAKNG